MASCTLSSTHGYFDSDQDSLKENRPPHSKSYKKQSKRKVLSSSSEESDVETEANNTSQSKRSKLDTADEVLANNVLHDGGADSSSSSDSDSHSQPVADNSKSHIRRRTSAIVQSDSENESMNNGGHDKDSANHKSIADKSVESEGSEASSSSGKSKQRRKRRPKVASDTDSDDDVPLTSREKTNPSNKLTSSLDPDLFDAEDSSSEGQRSNDGSNEESEEEVTNRLSSKYSGPASKKESKSTKRAAKKDDKLKIYSEKQRMIREQTVTVPVYQPPKKSLREFLSEQAPQLLKALKNQPQAEQNAEAASYRKAPKPNRPPKYIEQMEYLQGSPLLYTPLKTSRSKALVSMDLTTQDSAHSLTSAVVDCKLECSQQSTACEDEEDLPDLLSELTKARGDVKDSQCVQSQATEASHLPTEENAFKQPVNVLGRNSKLDRLNSEGNSQFTDYSQSSITSDSLDNCPPAEDNSHLTAVSADNSQFMATIANNSQPAEASAGDTQSESNNADISQSMTISADNSQSSAMSADNSQSIGNSHIQPESNSTIKVMRKSSPMKQRMEAKKLRLRRLLGDTVDLDVVPQLTCEADGVVVLDNNKLTAKKSHFKQFRSSFEKKAAKARQLEEERKKQREQKALKVVRNLPDGSQHELSMDAYSNKTAEETGGVHKLAVLKQILKAKLTEKRSEEFKRKEETIKLEALEEELPEDEILDEEFESSDEEEAGSNDDSGEEEVGPVLPSSETEVSGKCEFEKDEDLMRRVRAVLDSDEDEVTEGEESLVSRKQSYTSADANRLTESHMLDSLDRILGQQSVTSSAAPAQPVVAAEETTQGAISPESTHRDPIRKSVNLVDENAQDFDPDMSFSQSKSNDKGNALLGFTQEMFSTQQAEDELEGLCSGRFGTAPHSLSNAEATPPPTQPSDVTEKEPTTKVIAKRKEALQFSDEEISDTEQLTGGGDVSEEEVEEEDELDELADDSGEEGEQVEEVPEVQRGEENPSAERTLFLHKPRQTKREKLLGEYLEQEAELSGDEGGSDEDLDLSAEADILEMEKCDLENLGTDEQLRSQIAKAHAKQRIDDDARELMLMQEMLLPDGDLHSDSKRQRKFRWRNVEYGTEAVGYGDGASDDSDMSGTEAEIDSDVKAKQEKLEKERAEREAWLKDQRESQMLQSMDDSQLQLEETDSQLAAPAALVEQQGFTFGLAARRKKAGYILGKSKKYLERFKELHKNIKEEQRGPVSHKNLVFRPISKEDAESQQELMWNKS